MYGIAAWAADAPPLMAPPLPLPTQLSAPPAVAATRPVAPPGISADKPSTKPVITRPLWADLKPMQQQALAPLAGEWDRIDGLRKKKWLEVSSKFTEKTPDEQGRIQERMREWAKLTPEQRRVARDSYSRTKKLNPDQKSEQWQQYQQLSDEQKQKLAIDAAKSKPVANLPSALSKPKTVAPIKSTPKPVLERSVTPQATTQSVLQPSPPLAAEPVVRP
ncbi:MAG: DUF3106 domain-containing protein [Herminiimonas sp.]|nr:DUF3106 domain-containing protein [Herminiimonas sp.]